MEEKLINRRKGKKRKKEDKKKREIKWKIYVCGVRKAWNRCSTVAEMVMLCKFVWSWRETTSFAFNFILLSDLKASKQSIPTQQCYIYSISPTLFFFFSF